MIWSTRFVPCFNPDKPVDIDQLASQHPEMAQQLRKLYPTLLAINTLDATVSPIGSPNAIDKIHETQTLGDFRILRQIGRGGMGWFTKPNS